MEALTPRETIEEIFSQVPDWRVDRCKVHRLVDILFLSLSAMISGAEAFTEIEEFGRERLAWLSKYVELAHGIPSHDTIRRIFMEMDPSAFHQCFSSFVSWLYEPGEGELIALDGKQLRGMKSVETGKYGFYLVSAWASSQGLCLAQEKVAEKSNEIKALPEVLRMLDLKGMVVSIDAMGTQRDIAAQIIDQEGDYILSLKENQGTLYEEVVAFFEEEASSDYAFVHTDQDDAWDKGHGRIERRHATVAYDVETLRNFSKWKGLRSMIRIQAQRSLHGKTSQETRYYISSLAIEAKAINQYIRSHWAIENSLHWILDMIFHEDQSRIRTDHAPQNMAMLRKIALNLIKSNKGRYSVKAIRLKAAWNTTVLEQILFPKFHNA